MFDFLEEFAAIFDYLSNKKYVKCTSCGFLMPKPKKAVLKHLVNCPKCGENNWIETDAIEEGKI